MALNESSLIMNQWMLWGNVEQKNEQKTKRPKVK